MTVEVSGRGFLIDKLDRIGLFAAKDSLPAEFAVHSDVNRKFRFIGYEA
jgi:hypothetical protein